MPHQRNTTRVRTCLRCLPKPLFLQAPLSTQPAHAPALANGRAPRFSHPIHPTPSQTATPAVASCHHRTRTSARPACAPLLVNCSRPAQQRRPWRSSHAASAARGMGNDCPVALRILPTHRRIKLRASLESRASKLQQVSWAFHSRVTNRAASVQCNSPSPAILSISSRSHGSCATANLANHEAPSLHVCSSPQSRAHGYPSRPARRRSLTPPSLTLLALRLFTLARRPHSRAPHTAEHLSTPQLHSFCNPAPAPATHQRAHCQSDQQLLPSPHTAPGPAGSATSPRDCGPSPWLSAVALRITRHETCAFLVWAGPEGVHARSLQRGRQSSGASGERHGVWDR
jgi:hypothetical protein